MYHVGLPILLGHVSGSQDQKQGTILLDIPQTVWEATNTGRHGVLTC